MSEGTRSHLSITESALHHAVIEANPAALEYAVNTGCDARAVAVDAWGDVFEPIDLLWSVPREDAAPVLECLDILVRAGATSKTRAGAFREVMFHTAPAEVITAFLEKTDCDPNESLAYSTVFTPLLSAVAHHTDPYGVSVALLDAGADPNAVSTHAQVTHFITPTLPVHEAIVRGRRDVLDLLLQAGADPFVADARTDMRAIHWARHVVAAHDTETSRGILELFEGLESARDGHVAAWPGLKKEIMEAAWHPVRLSRLGYFDEIICP